MKSIKESDRAERERERFEPSVQIKDCLSTTLVYSAISINLNKIKIETKFKIKLEFIYFSEISN